MRGSILLVGGTEVDFLAESLRALDVDFDRRPSPEEVLAADPETALVLCGVCSSRGPNCALSARFAASGQRPVCVRVGRPPGWHDLCPGLRRC